MENRDDYTTTAYKGTRIQMEDVENRDDYTTTAYRRDTNTGGRCGEQRRLHNDGI